MTEFGFNDLHSFKDMIIFVQMCAPNDFPERMAYPGQYWTLDSTFDGLYLGLDMAVEEGPKLVFDQCWQLVEQAYQCYRAGDRCGGWFTLEKVHKLLRISQNPVARIADWAI